MVSGYLRLRQGLDPGLPLVAAVGGRRGAVQREDPADALLTEMLVPAPYEVPVKKAKKKAAGTQKGLRCKVVSDSSSDDSDAHSSHGNEEEEEKSSPPPVGGDKKSKADPSGQAEGSKKGRTLPPNRATTAADSGDEWLPRVKPLAKS